MHVCRILILYLPKLDLSRINTVFGVQLLEVPPQRYPCQRFFSFCIFRMFVILVPLPESANIGY